MAFSSVLQMYISWTNSIMCERGVLIEALNELQDGVIFCHLIELLTGTDLGVGQLDDESDEDQDCRNNVVQVALDYLEGIGVKVKATAAGVVCGELKSILDTMWAIILHCTIHTPDRPVNQRTVRNGRKSHLQWCMEELPHTASSLDTSTTMVKCFSHNNLLADLISVHCSFAREVDSENKMVAILANAILAAEEQLGISKTLVGPSDVINGTIDEHALLTYVALLQRKINLLMSRTSSLSSLSSNEDITFQISVNSRHEIVEALHKAYSFKFIRRQCNGNSRKFVLRLRGSKLKKLQEHCAQRHGLCNNTSDISLTSQMSTSLKAPHSHITKEAESVGVNASEQLSVGYAVSNQPNITSPIHSSPNAKQSPISHLSNEQQVESHPDRWSDPDQRSVEGQQVDSGGGGDNGVEMQQGVKDAWISLRRPTPSAYGDGVPKAEDELLGLLDAINLESANLRLELNESKEREHTFKEELERSVTSAAEEHVVSKLVQELELLRIENRRLFRDSANARNKNACDRRTTEKLQAIITKLQNDVDHLNAENFRLKLKNKLLKSHQLQERREGAYGQESEWDVLKETELLQQATSDVFLMDQFLDLPDDEDWVRYLTSSQQLLGNFSDVNVQMATNLSELNDELANLKVRNRLLQQENQFLKMASETSHFESGLTTNQCHSLEDNLSLAHKKNAKLVQDLQEVAKQPSPDADMHTFLRLRQLEEDNAMLEQRLELADEDRAVLKKELQQYKKNQSVIDAMLKGESDTSFKEVTKERGTKQDVPKKNVMPSLKCKDEREAAEAEQLLNGSVQEDLGCRINIKEGDSSLDSNYSNSTTNRDQINLTVGHEYNSYKQLKANSNAIKTHLRKSSLGDLIVAKSTNYPPKNASEAEDFSCISQSEMSEDDYDTVFDTNCEHRDWKSHQDTIDVLSKPSVDEVTDDDMNSQTTDESYVHNEHEVKYIQEDFLLNSMPRRSQFSTMNSSVTHLRSITEKGKHAFTSSPDNKPTHGTPAYDDNSLQDEDTDVSRCFGERNNPRLARLQELRRSLGIAKQKDNLSNHHPAELTPGELSEFELKSKLNSSGRGGITRWNTFNGIMAEDVDLGNSYIGRSSKQSSVPASQTRGIKKKMLTVETSTSKRSSALVSGRQCQRPGVANMALDDYVQALKNRVKSSETEADELSDEYISLPEHFQEPRRLAERSPKHITAIVYQDEPLESNEKMASNEKPVIKIETKTECPIPKENEEKKDGTDRLMVLPRVSGDGMSEGQAKNGKVIAEDVEVGEAVKYADSGTIQSHQIEFNTDTTLMQSPENKRTPSPIRTELPSIQKEEEVDSLVHSILPEADKSVSSTDKLHLSSSEDSKSYKHHLLKDEEQEYANSIIEKYLGQLSVLPQ